MSFREIIQLKLLLEIQTEWFSSALHTGFFLRQKLFLIKKQKSW